MEALKIMRAMLCLCSLVWAQLCGAQSEPASLATALDANTRADILADVARSLSSDYVLPEMAEQLAALVREQAAAGAYDAITVPADFAARLTQDLRRLSHDQHLGVLYEPPPEPTTNAAANPGPPLDPGPLFNHGFERVERLPGNIGYIDLRGFMQPAGVGRVCAAAMSFVADTDALIIDLRNNGGGLPQTMALLASYFFEQRTHLTDIYNRSEDSTLEFWSSEQLLGPRYGQTKPVYLLVSRRTFSAAEDFAYNLQLLRRATLVGEVTGGGAHPVRPYRLSHGLVLMVPGAKSINPISHTNWEGVGVQPDIRVPAFAALHVARDRLLKGLAAKHANLQFATLLANEIQANAAALSELQRMHAEEQALPLQFVKREPKQLRASSQGRDAAEFLSALNTGSLAVMQRFRERHSMNLQRLADDYALYVDSGGFKVHSIVATTTDGITLLARRNQDSAWSALRFVIDDAAPHPVLRLEVLPTPPPRR